MPNHHLLNGLSGHLQSSESWGRQQALELLRQTLAQSMSELTLAQRRDYVRLQREALTALKAVETENAALIEQFTTRGLAQLRSKLGGLDPQGIFINTRYLEKLDTPLPWEPRSSAIDGLANSPRFRRAVDEWKYRTHVSRLTLWQAACLNFDFATGTPQQSGHSYVDASFLSGVDEKRLSVSQFIAISRELDLGGQLHTTLASALGVGGTLHGLIETSARANLRFEALEAYRNRTRSGVTLTMYEALVAAIDDSGPALPFDTLSMDLDRTLFQAVPFVPSGESIPVPLVLIHVASLGVVSYFPFRPSGAMHYHLDAKSAGAHFLTELKASHHDGELGWFSRQLPVTEINQFKDLLREEPRPEGLSQVAGFLYDGFHTLFPKQTLEHVRFVHDPKPARPRSLVQALTQRHVQHYQANLGMLATRRSERDLQGVIDGAAAIAAEIMELLMTPVPGGVTGLNRVMQVVVFANLSYSLIVGIDNAARGQASDFAAAMADVADLAINGLLISTAGRVHRQRIEGLLQRLGNPRKVPRSDGSHGLWKPDIGPYAIANPHLLDGQVANAQGLYLINGHQYARVQQGQQHVVAQVSLDPATKGFVLKSKNGNGFAAPIVFDPRQQAWVLDLQGARQLSDTQLIGQMLPNGEAPVPAEQVRTLLRSTAVPRATLDAIWAGDAPPVNLIEASRRVQVDRVIEQLSSGFHRSANLPAHAGSAIFSLLTQLSTWPAEAIIQVHDAQGSLLESHAASDSATHAITLKRRDDGTYTALDAADTDVPTQESLLEQIIRQQPVTSTLGKEGSPQLSEAQRIARLRVQISALAKTERIALFDAMTRYAGQSRHQVPAGVVARAFVPIKAATNGVQATPLLSKLRAQFAPLSLANLQQLLDQRPLNAAQQSTYLTDATLPDKVREHLEQHRTTVRIDAVIDGLYNPRAFSKDTDLWAREFAASLLRERLDRHFVVTEMADGPPRNRYKNSGPDDTTVELLHHGDGRFEAYDMRNGGPIAVSPVVDSFYLAIASVLQPHERTQLGMSSATDAQGLRKTLGDLMSDRRSPAGLVSLLDYSLGQYQKHNLVLPSDLQPNPEGLYDWQGEQLLSLYGGFYPVTFDQRVGKWRLKHPQKVGVDTPRLEHNRHGAWRLESESPLAWDEHHLFSRLGVGDFNVDQPTSTRLLKLTDTPAAALREVHCAGLPPPPLLKDSSKRFGIERQILHFIKAMTTYSATRTARPSLQLLLVCSLAQWPASHVLELHDEEGRTFARYPGANAAAPQKIRLSQAQSRSLEPLAHLTRDDDLTRALLGELPESQEERLFKLAKKIAEHAYRERTQLFDTLYAQSERSTNAQQNRLHQHYPQLPASVIQALLRHTTAAEAKQLHDHDWVPLRVAEQAKLTANDVRLNRAFEGLYLTTLANPDSEKIMLHALKLLPGWPAELRLDIHQNSASGPLLESAGHLAGRERKVLARIDERYQAYDGTGQLLSAQPRDLLTALWEVLDDSQRKALGLDDSSDLTPLRHAIAELALNQRIAIKDLLGLPHIPYWLQPPMRVDSSFTAYPFNVRNLWPFGGLHSADIVSKARELYPSMSRARAQDFIDSLHMNEPAVLLELEQRKAEYQALEFGLQRWATTEQAIDADDPLNLGRRHLIKARILQAWRRETYRATAGGIFDAYTLELQLDDNTLPDADFILSTRGFEHIGYLKIAGNGFPATGDAFLGKFANLQSLKLDCMLTELPRSVTDMTQLVQLDLNDNDIVLTPESRQRLAGMTNLEVLDLDENPLGIAPDVSGMHHLLNLNLRRTGISQWPIGAEQLTQLHRLELDENQITTIPDAVFTNPAMEQANSGTYLHGNPLDAPTLQRLAEYRQQNNARLGGPMPGQVHVAPLATTASEMTAWLAGVPKAEHARRQTLWDQLKAHEGASPDDAFRLFRDLTQSFDYVRGGDRRIALTARVWRLLHAMVDSHELREDIFLHTYEAGTCGDGAILVFMDMEIRHKQHEAITQPTSNQATQALKRFLDGLFYLNNLDRFADAHIDRLRNEREVYNMLNPMLDPQKMPDDAEIKLYLRLNMRVAFDLPLEQEGRLYSPGEDLTAEDLNTIRAGMDRLKSTNEAQSALLTNQVWINYLKRTRPKRFSIVATAAERMLGALQQQVPNVLSMEYQERRQSITQLKTAETDRLVSQLTQRFLNTGELPTDD
ncbi:NEL-type E3 ubiquitin ligase domain-containing protein [Pseudomonas sp. 18175]|uniref:NEL-type E3 ubiquitin ligase domain-containing protein n=1 Tax=Pseudomonas sp. 18175 TaxID=3390056 RepID=UPI003D1DBA42